MPVDAEPPQTLGDLARSMQDRGVRRVHVLGWRDMADEASGGSEMHANEFMTRWAAAGFDIVERTSHAPGLASIERRNGYDIVRRGGRYGVFPRAVASEIARRMGPRDALVEIWNGVPWFSPVWFRGPRLTFMHHVHGPMWDQLFPPRVATLGRLLEARVAPPFYRRTEMVTPSEATRAELLHLGLHPDRVTAVENGVDPKWSPGGPRHPRPLVLGVGRLAPVKRFGLLLEAAATARESVPDLELVIVGEGPDRAELESWIARHGAASWVSLPGRLSDDDLRDLYRRAWVLSNDSLAEGWGLTISEAGACGTPAVVSDISGHRCSVVHGETGLLCEPGQLGPTLASVLRDPDRLDRMGRAALARSATLTWDASALGILRVLERDVTRRVSARGR